MLDHLGNSHKGVTALPQHSNDSRKRRHCLCPVAPAIVQENDGAIVDEMKNALDDDIHAG